MDPGRNAAQRSDGPSSITDQDDSDMDGHDDDLYTEVHNIQDDVIDAEEVEAEEDLMTAELALPSV